MSIRLGKVSPKSRKGIATLLVCDEGTLLIEPQARKAAIQVLESKDFKPALLGLTVGAFGSMRAYQQAPVWRFERSHHLLLKQQAAHSPLAACYDGSRLSVLKRNVRSASILNASIEDFLTTGKLMSSHVICRARLFSISPFAGR